MLFILSTARGMGPDVQVASEASAPFCGREESRRGLTPFLFGVSSKLDRHWNTPMVGERSAAVLGVFLALLLISSASLAAFALTTGFGGGMALLMWSVGLSAMLALKFTGRSLAELGWGWGPARYHLIALALPVTYCLIAYGGAALVGLVHFATPDRLLALTKVAHVSSLAAPLGLVVALGAIAGAGIIQTMSLALGEEIGWRGLLAPRLVALLGFVGGSLATGVVWSAWHMPLILFGSYNAGGDVRLELMSFAVMVLAMSGPIVWLRLRAQSLWPCVTFHACHNLVVQGIFDPLTVRGPSHITMVGEFGVAMAVVVLLTSLPFWLLGLRPMPRSA